MILFFGRLLFPLSARDVGDDSCEGPFLLRS